MKKRLLLLFISSFLSVSSMAQLRGKTFSDPYPNPAVSTINFDYAFQTNNAIKLMIYNIIGKKLESINLHNQTGSVKLNITYYSPGVYFYSFQANDKALHTGKFYIKN